MAAVEVMSGDGPTKTKPTRVSRMEKFSNIWSKNGAEWQSRSALVDPRKPEVKIVWLMPNPVCSNDDPKAGCALCSDYCKRHGRSSRWANMLAQPFTWKEVEQHMGKSLHKKVVVEKLGVSLMVVSNLKPDKLPKGTPTLSDWMHMLVSILDHATAQSFEQKSRVDKYLETGKLEAVAPSMKKKNGRHVRTRSRKWYVRKMQWVMQEVLKRRLQRLLSGRI